MVRQTFQFGPQEEQNLPNCVKNQCFTTKFVQIVNFAATNFYFTVHRFVLSDFVVRQQWSASSKSLGSTALTETFNEVMDGQIFDQKYEFRRSDFR